MCTVHSCVENAASPALYMVNRQVPARNDTQSTKLRLELVHCVQARIQDFEGGALRIFLARCTRKL